MCELYDVEADRKRQRRGVAQVRFWQSTELIEYVVPWLQSLREVSRLCRTCEAAVAVDWRAYCVAASRGECSAREWGRLSQRRLVSALARLTAGAEAEAGTDIESRGCVAAFVLGDCVRPRGNRGCYGLGGDGDAAMNAWLLCRGGALGALACIFGSGGKLTGQSKVRQWCLREACGWAIGATMLGASAEDGAAVGAQAAIEAAELVWRLGVVRKSIDRLLQPCVGRGLRAACARLLGRFEVAASLGRSLDRRRVGLLAGLDRPRGLEALLCYACDDQGEAAARSAASDALRRRASEASQATRADAAAAVVGRSSRSVAGHRFVSPAGVACLACLARALPNELASAGAIGLLGDVLKAADNLVSLKPPSPKLTRRYEPRRASHGRASSAKRRCTTCRDPPPPSCHRRRTSIATCVSLPACVAADERRLLEVVADAALGLARVARRSALRRAGLDRFGRAQLDLQAAVLEAVPPHTLVSFLRFADRSRGPPRLANASARAADMCAAALTNLAAGSHTNRARLLEAGVLDALRDAIKATPNTDAAPLRAALRAVKPPDSYVRLAAPLPSPPHGPSRADLFYYDSDQDDDDDDDEDNYSSEASDDEDDDEDEDLEDDEEDEDDDDDDELDDFNDLDEEDLDDADEDHFF